MIGCGGTIKRLSNLGVDVRVLYLSDGVSSRNTSTKELHESEINSRLNDAKKALEILGVTSFDALGYRDNMLDSYPLLEVAKAVESVVEKHKPTFVITHSSSDLNVDHRVASSAGLTACRPQPGKSVRGIVSFEVSSSTGWQFDQNSAFTPNAFVDITEQLSDKLLALEQFTEEIRDFPHARSISAIRSQSIVRGSHVGLPAAEAFEIRYLLL